MRRCEGKEPTPTPKGVGSGASTVPRVPKCKKKIQRVSGFEFCSPSGYSRNQDSLAEPVESILHCLPTKPTKHSRGPVKHGTSNRNSSMDSLIQKKKRAGEKRRVPPTCSGDTLGAGRNSANSLFSKPCRNVENCSKLLPCKPANGPLIAH